MSVAVVTQGTFDALTCNRCGNCCERFWVHTRGRYATHEAALGFLENYGGFRAAHPECECEPGSYYPDGHEGHRHGLDDMLFFGQLEIWQEKGAWRGRCAYFSRDADGTGFCAFYERRPYMCSAFPYGEPVPLEECSWNVEILDYQPWLQGGA